MLLEKLQKLLPSSAASACGAPCLAGVSWMPGDAQSCGISRALKHTPAGKPLMSCCWRFLNICKKPSLSLITCSKQERHKISQFRGTGAAKHPEILSHCCRPNVPNFLRQRRGIAPAFPQLGCNPLGKGTQQLQGAAAGGSTEGGNGAAGLRGLCVPGRDKFTPQKATKARPGGFPAETRGKTAKWRGRNAQSSSHSSRDG